MPVTGVASAQLRLDTSDLLRAPNAAQQAATGVERALGRVDSASKKTEANLGQLAGAFGISLGAAGLVQFGRMTIAADAMATSYRRQSVAALHLAGSQGKLNSLLVAYERATGGAVDRATALADVSRLQAVGFADSAAELERFVTIARGASLAMGTSQEYIIGQLQLTIANQSKMRLDQIGLGVVEVDARIEQLRASTRGLSSEMAFQQAVLGLLEEKFGGLAKSAEASATGAEAAQKAFKDLRLEWGQLTGGTVGFFGMAITGWLKRTIDSVTWLKINVAELGQSFGLLSRNWNPRELWGGGVGGGGAVPSGTSRTGQRLAAGLPAPRFDEPQTSLIREWSDSVQAIERDANADRLSATRSFEESQASTIRNYHTAMGREQEDFGRQRARAERDFADSIADIRRDAGRREERAAEQLARNITRARTESAERIVKWEAEHAERVADLRGEGQERIAKIEEDYARERERAQRDHRDNLLDAASNLDARAIYQEQRRFARQTQDAAESHREQVSDAGKQLAQQLEQEQESFDKRLRAEEAALQEQIKTQEEAHAEQLRGAREADDERIADMRADFEERKRIEDEDRAIRLARMAEDHAEQLDEQARQHGVRLTQIAEQAAEERTKLDEEFEKALAGLEMRTERWSAAQDKITERAIKNFDTWWEHVNKAFTHPLLPATGGAARGLPEMIQSFQNGGYVPRDMLAYLHGGETVIPRGGAGGNSINIAAGAFQFSGVSGNPAEMTAAVEAAFASILGRMGGRA